jgi:hypothetical protein
MIKKATVPGNRMAIALRYFATGKGHVPQPV